MATDPKPKLLVVDDDEDLRTQMRWALADEYNVVLAADRVGALLVRGPEEGGDPLLGDGPVGGAVAAPDLAGLCRVPDYAE